MPPYIIEPIWEQFSDLLLDREPDHPLGYHRPRVPDPVVIEKVVEVLVFGCAYEKIADGSCYGHHAETSWGRVDLPRGDGGLATDGARGVRAHRRPGVLRRGRRLCCITKARREALKLNEILRNAPKAVDMDLTHQREAGEHAEDMTSEPEGVTYEGVDATAIGQPPLIGSGGGEKAILHHQTAS